MKPGGFLRAAVGNEVPTRSAAPIRKGESTAVSYTHLDVYKRQALDNFERKVKDALAQKAAEFKKYL